MQGFELLQLIAAIIIIVPLIRGAISDVNTRVFPKEYWSFPAKAAGIFTIMMYLTKYNDPTWIATYLGASLIAALILYVIGIRFGSGGDCRALIYCAILAPLILFTWQFLILLCLISLVLAIWELGRKSDKHPFERHIPWVVAICSAFILCVAEYGLMIISA